MTAPVQHPMFIDGQFVSWQGDKWLDVVNPATEEIPGAHSRWQGGRRPQGDRRG